MNQVKLFGNIQLKKFLYIIKYNQKPISHIFPSTSFSLSAATNNINKENIKETEENNQYFEYKEDYYPWNKFNRKIQDNNINNNDPVLYQDLLHYSLQESDMHRRWGNGVLKRYPITTTINRSKENIHIPIPLNEMQSYSLYPSY